MDERLRLHPLVADDLQAATVWYDNISVELGNRFRNAINAVLDDIVRRPSLYGTAMDRYRFARVRRFPYVVLFEEHTDGWIHVYGVLHGSSDPQKWLSRKAPE
ncbi:type II toxin-antitoxin system RelE/ParE family toxin [Aeoliella sp.]|uniref:type II toxin-antitoxin system RelE/ParE family toxin n=1 Tax=Aeoliella sp. TaxID=2795800 RepID=UPI003CCB78EF